MKEVPAYSIQNPDKVEAYTNGDLADLQPVFKRAEAAWLAEWRAQGSKDEGTCTGGKGFEVWYCGPKKRTAERQLVVRCDFVQGNSSAQQSKHAALVVLQEAGVQAHYTDGWMD